MQKHANGKSLIASTEPAEQINKAVARLRAAAHAVLNESRKTRLSMAQQTREALQINRLRIRSAVDGIRHAARESIGIQETITPKREDIRLSDCEEQEWDFALDDTPSLGTTKQDLMRIIQQHPEGVSLMEIGNELGTDWRGLVNWSHRLVIDGKVDKFDELFYPARE